jgi:TPP-dependent pyruvate/acetoin dehydrogenase alpha subunit
MSLSVSASMRSFPLSNLLSAKSGEPVQPKTAEEEFLEIARKSPLERLRDKILADMKTSEEALAQMGPEARTAVEDEIKRRMMEALQASKETGAVVDKSA